MVKRFRTQLIPLSRYLRIGIICACLFLQAFTTHAVTIVDAQVTQNPNPKVPLAWICTFKTDVPAQAQVKLHNGRKAHTLPTASEFALEHEVVVLGVRPGRENFLEIKASDADGNEAERVVLQWDVDPLPKEFPDMEVYQSKPKRMEPGFTLIPCNRWALNGLFDNGFGVILGLNDYGDVVWSYRADHNIADVKPLSDGNLLIHYGRDGHMMVIDMLGNTIQRWHTTLIPKEYYEGSTPLDMQTLHHEVLELPSGNYLALSTEIRYYEKYPDSEYDIKTPWYPAYVVGDVIVEFEPDGTIVNRIKLLDLLDPFRIGYDSLSQYFWRDIYFDTGLLSARPVDWSHANSLDYNPVDKSLLISINHQDAVIKLDYPSGKIEWIMGYPTGWSPVLKPKVLKPVGDGHYFFHQHAARLTPVGTLLLFDNGNFRARPYDARLASEKNFSRVVELEVDEESKEYKEVWSYGGRSGEMFFSPILGEADWMPNTQNILITDGGRIRREDGTNGGHPNQGHEWARVLEVTRAKPSEKVFEVVFDDPLWGWTVYRSERIPGLYPHGKPLKVLEYTDSDSKKIKLEAGRLDKDLPKIEEEDVEALEALPYL